MQNDDGDSGLRQLQRTPSQPLCQLYAIYRSQVMMRVVVFHELKVSIEKQLNLQGTGSQ
jgi:hypothetical protein